MNASRGEEREVDDEDPEEAGYAKAKERVREAVEQVGDDDARDDGRDEVADPQDRGEAEHEGEHEDDELGVPEEEPDPVGDDVHALASQSRSEPRPTPARSQPDPSPIPAQKGSPSCPAASAAARSRAPAPRKSSGCSAGGRNRLASRGGRSSNPSRRRHSREAVRDEVGDVAGPPHAGPEPAPVVPPAGRLADERAHPAGAKRVLRIEPFVEEARDLEREPEEDVGGVARPRVPGGPQDLFDLVVGEPGNDRGDEDPDRDAAPAQALDGREAPPGARRARLHASGQLVVQGGDGDRHVDERLLRHRGEEVRVVLHEDRLGDDRRRVRAFLQELEDPARRPKPALDGLIGIGVGPEGDRGRAVAARAQLAPQQGDRVRLVEQLRLEVAPRRQPEPRVGRARVAVDAAVLRSPGTG